VFGHAFIPDATNQCFCILLVSLAVVLVNHMTTKISAMDVEYDAFTGIVMKHGNFTSRLVPALGESFAHATTTRLLLSPTIPSMDDSRECRLIKSSHKPPGKALYRVTEQGIRDIVAEIRHKRPRIPI